MAVRFKFAQDGASRGSSDVGHIGEIFMVYVDFDLPRVQPIEAAAIANAEQNRHEALNVVTDHQVVGSAHGHIKMCNRYQGKEPPRRGVKPDDFVNRSQRQMQQHRIPRSG